MGFSGLVGLMVIFGWVSFDMGRQSAGFDRSVAKATEVDLTSRISRLEEQNIELGRKAVNLEGKLKMALSAQNKVSREMGALSDENINILAISTSEIKLSVIIDEENTLNAIKKLHTIFDLD